MLWRCVAVKRGKSQMISMGNIWLHCTTIIAQTSTPGSSDYTVKGCETSEVLLLVYFYMPWAQWICLLPGANHRACLLLESECIKLRFWSIKIDYFQQRFPFWRNFPSKISNFFALVEFYDTYMLTWGCTFMHSALVVVLVLKCKSWSSITHFPLNM